MYTSCAARRFTSRKAQGRLLERRSDLLDLIAWVDVDGSLAEAAGLLGRRFWRTHPGIEATDLVIAALVQHLDAELKTTHVKHFPMIKNLRAAYSYSE